MTFLDFAEKVIAIEKRALTQNEIWEIGEKNNYHKDLNTKGRTPWQTLGSSIRKDIRDNPDTRFIKFEDDTFKYYLKSLPENKSSPQNDTNKIIKKAGIIINLMKRIYINIYLFMYLREIKYIQRQLMRKNQVDGATVFGDIRILLV